MAPKKKPTWRERSLLAAVTISQREDAISFASASKARGVLAIPARTEDEDILWHAYFFHSDGQWRVIANGCTPTEYFNPMSALTDATAARDEEINNA